MANVPYKVTSYLVCFSTMTVFRPKTLSTSLASLGKLHIRNVSSLKKIPFRHEQTKAFPNDDHFPISIIIIGFQCTKKKVTSDNELLQWTAFKSPKLGHYISVTFKTTKHMPRGN